MNQHGASEYVLLYQSHNQMLRISIDRHVIAANAKSGERKPVIAIELVGNSSCIYAHEVFIPGPSRLVYRPDNPDLDDKLSTAWLEVEGDVYCGST